MAWKTTPIGMADSESDGCTERGRLTLDHRRLPASARSEDEDFDGLPRCRSGELLANTGGPFFLPAAPGLSCLLGREARPR